MMKRKILTLALCAATALALAVNAGAVPSVTGDPAPSVSAAAASDGTVIPTSDLTVTAVQDAASLPAQAADVLNTAYQEIVSAPSTSAFLADNGLTAAVEQALTNTGVKTGDLAPASMFDVSVSGAAAQVLAAKGNVTVSFAMPGVKAGSTVVVLHLAVSGWEVVPSSAGDGSVSATFTSLSPVAILTGTGSASGLDTSLQTSDVNLAAPLICGAALCLAVCVLCVKRGRTA